MKNLAIILASCAIAACAPFISEARSPVMCTMQYAPVCGTTARGEFKTYGNSCTLGAEGGIYQHEGECTEAELAGRGTVEAYVPPAHCIAWYDGCNSCARSANGEAACTLRACFAQGAGYCTAYGDTETDEPKVEPTRPAQPNTSAPNGSSFDHTAGDQIEAVEQQRTQAVGFFSRIWTRLSAWLGGLF